MIHEHGHEGHEHTESERAKDQQERHSKYEDALSEDLTNFYGELTEVFPSIRLTSGRREKKEGQSFSHHHHGDAIDIGREHSDVYEYLTNTREGLSLMNKYGLGILDETDPEILKKTGGTGPHYHIGKDKGLVARTTNRLTNFEGVKQMHSFISLNPTYDYSKKEADQNVNRHSDVGMTMSSGILGSVGGIDLTLPNNVAGQMFVAEVEKEQEKDRIIESKNTEDPARDQLQAMQSAHEARKAALLNTFANIRQRDINNRTGADSGEQTSELSELGGVSYPDVSTSYGDLPDAF